MIVTFTPNPALDKTAVVPGFALGSIFRTSDVRMLAGGKGFNVARSMRVLGGDPLVIAPLAGHTGRLITDLARAERLRYEACWFDGETRTCLSIIDPQTGVVSELYEQGPPIPPEVWDSTLALLRHHLRAGDILTISGGFPRGVPPDALLGIARWAHETGVRAMMDTYGTQLRHALAGQPALAKCNAHEAGGLLGQAITNVDDAFQAAADIRAMGARSSVVTLGAMGAIGIDEHGTPWAWRAPRVRSVSAVGSGDACFAGIVLGLAAGLTLANAARQGVAAGAANTLHTGAGMFERADATRLLAAVVPWDSAT
jgi:1-phosphofructokinase family hexose kinase